MSTYLQNPFYLKFHPLKIFIKKLKNSDSDIWYQQWLGRMTASNFYRISTKTQSFQNNISNNA